MHAWPLPSKLNLSIKMCSLKGRELESRFYPSLFLFLMHRSNDNINNHNLNNLYYDYFEYDLVYYRHYYYYYY